MQSLWQNTFRRFIFILTVAALVCAGRACGAAPIDDTKTAAQALIARVLPDHAGSFICEIIPPADGKDVFEIEAVDGKIVLRGNDGVSIATALNWYLHAGPKLNYDWHATGPLSFAGDLPLPEAKVRQVCAAAQRYFLNYCTYGYAFAFTDLAGWQRALDWMALNGINRPFMQCGQEAVWLKVWQSYGLSESQIRAYFTGPAYLPWHRMANFDRYDGPLLMSYITGQMELQKKLLAQVRALGMKPVLSAFAGHVPRDLAQVKPDIKLTSFHNFLEKPDISSFLSPTDPLFAEIEQRFIKTQAEMYGTNHLYATDPFNEMDPPSWEPSYMAAVGKAIYGGMTAADPDAIWYQMSWTYHGKWLQKTASGLTPLAGMVQAVPKGRLVFLDYYCEENEFYTKTENFYDSPFLWNYLGNYGGNNYFRAPMHVVAQRLEKALQVPNCVGVGSVLEGVAGNPEIFAMVFEQPWHANGALDDQKWIADYAVLRAGRADPLVIKGWEILRAKVLNPGPQGHFDRGSTLTQVPPRLTAPKNVPPAKGPVHGRPPQLLQGLVEALDAFYAAAPQSQQADGYRYDVVDTMRQALAYYSDDVLARAKDAYARHDQAELTRQVKTMLGIVRDMDELVGTRQEFLLGRWIQQARAWGATVQEADYYEKDARMLITRWGGHLTDYAHREWNGLLRDYYLPRWQRWAKTYAPKAVAGEPEPSKEEFWTRTDGNYATTPIGDPVQVSKKLLAKYRDEFLQ